MTPKPTRTRGGSLEISGDADLLAGLWQEAPFARLPADAPPELQQYVRDIDNPNRVYAIHLASRRHDFQSWVERYNQQLRVGCGQPNCTTPTCFTCRKRLAGKTPVRRYNNTSARTLAVYMASQDNPQNGLCPKLRPSRDTAATSGTLIFSAHSPSTSRNDSRKTTVRTSSASGKEHFSKNSKRRSPSPYTNSQQLTPDASSGSPRSQPNQAQSSPKASASSRKPSITVSEKTVNKDHRSFAANLFGTVAFKMLEWLTPGGLEAISQQITSLEGEMQAKTEASSGPDRTASRSTSPSMRSAQPGHEVPSGPVTPATDQSCDLGKDERSEKSCQDETRLQPMTVLTEGQAQITNQQSITRSRSSSVIPTETLSYSEGMDDRRPDALSPRMNIVQREVPARPSKTGASMITLGIPEKATAPAFLDSVSSTTSSLTQDTTGARTPDDNANTDTRHERESKLQVAEKEIEPEPVCEEATKQDAPTALLSNMLPESLSRLDIEIVEFMYNVYQEDGTSENLSFFRPTSEVACPEPENLPRQLIRQPGHRSVASRKQWKDFNEQTIFSVLSNPQAALQSFTKNGRLYDSQTLWYCLHRMAQVAPSLVFHSLWIAAGSLFENPPRPREQLAKNKSSRRTGAKLSNAEAGHLMAVCMHALVAAAPYTADSRALYEMSRIRSSGLALPGGISSARQPSSLCLDYDDVFSNELILRLARRVFLSLTPYRYRKTGPGGREPSRPTSPGVEILQTLLKQLDYLGTSSTPILDFNDNERLLHGTRVPTILLDWARTILLLEWNGRFDFPTDGPFAGALSFIEAMHHNRNVLLLGDTQFRVDFLSDRLDSIQMPVDWLDFKSTNDRRHILDYPYIFSPDNRVTFFRSINFARMSRMYEESSSLKTRMNAIVDPGSLITNPHHKTVLQDLLDTASSKYLILEIGRENVVRDAFDQLWRREKRELLRPLKVHLGEQSGEEGFDSGGVQQEFFRLAISECLEPAYGAFVIDERSRMAWFSPGSLTEDWKYELVGLLVSLAVYNGVTLPVTFPKALYRKLLGYAVDELHHIVDGWSDLAQGLTKLLEWNEKDGKVEDVFARTYEFSVSAFGHHITREMSGNTPWPESAAGSEVTSPPHVMNPTDAPLVTRENRDTYVRDYVRYLTDVSVRPQYLAFERGFRACLDEKSLSLLSPSTLQSLVEGIQEIDIPELRRHARYVGWDASHHTIRDFWSIVRKYDDNMKRRLLEFVTSSDRVPVGGMKNLQFVIQKNGDDESNGGHLPTAYTCYGTLLLAEYRDKEMLRNRLAMALENSQGFGFA